MKTKHLNDYINYIIKPREQLNNLPICPYAKKYFNDSYFEFSDNFEEKILYFLENYPKDKKIVALLSENIEKYNTEYLDSIVKKYQKKFNKNDLWIIYDHPNAINEIGGIKTNNDYYAIFLIQRLTEIVELSDKLKSTKYYDVWTKEYYNEIVIEREKLLIKKMC